MDETKQPSYLDLPDDELGAPPSMVEPVQEEQEKEVTVEEAPVVQEQEEQQEQETPVAEVQEEKKEEVVETPQIDYKAEYERLTQPFKANGKEIKVNSVEDAVELMQMGANYSKKMAALKPHLKLIKMLDKHGLMDESKLSYLIDLNGKNPEAIAKLVKDSGLDPMEMDENKADDYKPTS